MRSAIAGDHGLTGRTLPDRLASGGRGELSDAG
jgi:hypothetical protein